jgi:hypothetical protein
MLGFIYGDREIEFQSHGTQSHLHFDIGIASLLSTSFGAA